MQKKLVFVSAFATVAIFASYAVSNAQFGGGGVGLAPTNGPDIENEIRNLYVHLRWEKQETFAGEESSAKQAELVAKHAELLQLLSKYMATARIKKAVADFETIIEEMPGTDEAKRAGIAIEVLNGKPSPSESLDNAPEPRRPVNLK